MLIVSCFDAAAYQRVQVRKAFLLLALEPPGNIARDLALYRRRLFAGTGESSALALPEVAPLAAAPLKGRTGSRWPGQSELAQCWRGIEGNFAMTGPGVDGGSLYLALRGPIESLALRARETLGRGEGAQAEAQDWLDSLLPCGRGFYLCSLTDPVAAQDRAQALDPPLGEFGDCSLLLLGISLVGKGLRALAWRELGRAKRRTGPPIS